MIVYELVIEEYGRHTQNLKISIGGLGCIRILQAMSKLANNVKCIQIFDIVMGSNLLIL